jgi:NTE family protein
VRQGEDADALFVVVSGRFAVEIEGHDGRVAEISRGSTIGEIAFFTGGPRTATVRAIRDGVVVRLTRADFDAISASSPSVLTAITVTLAERLAAETRRSAQISRDAHATKAPPRPRTIAVIGAAGNQIPAPFLAGFFEAAKSRAGTLVVSSNTIGDVLETSRSDIDLTDALNRLESRFPTVIFIADNDLTPWSEKAIRQADELMIVASAPADPITSTVPLSRVEAFALTLHQPRSRRLVIVHNRRGIVQGTRHWLRLREPQMHHHVALGEPDDVARLWRFLSGDALGFVACGGGAYCAAHIGVYRAFREAGIAFDFIGGTSGGAAMGAAFAQHIDPLEIDGRVHRMFIKGRALGRYTLPRYGLLDHAHFDSHLQREYGDLRIEDLWTPFFAVSADLTRCEVELHRTGELWCALRASAAIPGLLPPYYTDDGRMLVDGSVVANVPIETMHSLKRGPNVVVSFETSESERPAVDYAALPGRAELIWKTLNPAARGQLPRAPSAASVLVKSLMANRSHFERHLEPDDWLLAPPVPPQMGALDWRRHTELMETAYSHTRAAIASRPRHWH